MATKLPPPSNRTIFFTHLMVWLLFATVPFTFNANLFGWRVALFRTLLPTLTLLMVFYGNAYLARRYIFKATSFRIYRPFLAYAIIVPFCFIGAEWLFKLVNELSNIQTYLTFEVWEEGALVSSNRTPDGVPRSVIGFSVMFIIFVSSLYGLGQEVQRRDRQEAALRATNLRHEIKLLRQQINPHFLFNALNNLYAIVQLNPQRAGEFVLKLSDMLRYVTYDCQQERVALEKEINYLNNYLYFQEWRGQEFQRLDIQLPSDLPQSSIEPMLLLPFVENAFKHSYDPLHPEERWIKIVLQVDKGWLHFEVVNSRSTVATTQDASDEYTGIGVENVRKRLQLLYPSQHQLVVQGDPKQHRILLTLQLPPS